MKRTKINKKEAGFGPFLTIQKVMLWWWSDGKHGRLLYQSLPFESRCVVYSFSSLNMFKENKNIFKEAGVWPI